MEYTEKDEVIGNLKDNEIFNKASKGWTKVKFEDMTIDFIKEQGGAVFYIKPNELFKQGLCFDGYSQSAFIKVYEALGEENKRKMREVVLKDPYRFANLMEKMWKWFK